MDNQWTTTIIYPLLSNDGYIYILIGGLEPELTIFPNSWG